MVLRTPVHTCGLESSLHDVPREAHPDTTPPKRGPCSLTQLSFGTGWTID
jgi:hypothetical protein